jgi:hypothetical protein
VTVGWVGCGHGRLPREQRGNLTTDLPPYAGDGGSVSRCRSSPGNCGLLGPNGAGETTTFTCHRFHGEAGDASWATVITRLPVLRARLGISTYQEAPIFRR